MRYLHGLMESFRSPALRGKDQGATSISPPCDPAGIADELFTTLTSRQFSYLGRTQSKPYRDLTLAILRQDICKGRPARFFFDLGPGYHASLDPAESGLVFDIGLAELLALRQVSLFDIEVRKFYSPGVSFVLVIDNLCGLYTNDVPLARSRDYVGRLRLLIDQLGLGDTCEVLAESEAFTTTEYETVLARVEASEPPAEPSDEEIENIARFLGRRCCSAEAAARIELYRRTAIATETLLADVVDGVRLTQRATSTTLGFRSFPGGAQRIQVGEIVVAVDEAGRTRPVLMTSRNRIRYDIRPLQVADALPAAIKEICYVRLLPHPDRRQPRKA